MKRKNRSKLAPLAIIIFVISGIMLFLSRYSTDIANTLDERVSAPFRRAMAAFGDLFDFSLFELLILSLPLIAALIIWRSIVVFKRGEGGVRFVANILAIALILYSGNTLALGISYNTTSIDERMSLPDTEITEESLKEAFSQLCIEVNALSEGIDYDGGESKSGYTLDEISEKLCLGFDALNSKYGFPYSFASRAKSARALHVLSYLRLSGIYTYYTGEANVNTDYPDYEVAFTAAHEMSHQRGVLRENEASFVGYLACNASSDEYLRYSAALSMLGYVGTALWRTNADAYYEILRTLDSRALSDLNAAYAVTDKYGDTFLADISNFVNDIFLKSNGTDGVITYSRVVTLYMSYREAVK